MQLARGGIDRNSTRRVLSLSLSLLTVHVKDKKLIRRLSNCPGVLRLQRVSLAI